MSSKLSSLVENNKAAASTAAIITGGNIANKQATKLIAAKAPMMMKGFIDTPLGRLLVANMAQMAIQQYRPDSELANRIGQGMVVAAYQEVLASYDVEGMVDSLLSNSKLASVFGDKDD